MRLLLPVVIAAVFLVPSLAQANRAQCTHLAHQLVHADTMKQRAAQAGNDLWLDRYKAHIDRLEDRHAQICPDSAAAQQAAQQLRDLMKAAMNGAISFFTGGAL